MDYSLLTEQPVSLKHFLLIIKSTGKWGPNGKGEGKNEVHSAAEHRSESPRATATLNKLSSFLLQWSDGPTCFQDILLVMYKGKFAGSYWHVGYQDHDYRTSLNILSRWPDRVVPKGRDNIDKNLDELEKIVEKACEVRRADLAGKHARSARLDWSEWSCLRRSNACSSGLAGLGKLWIRKQ